MKSILNSMNRADDALFSGKPQNFVAVRLLDGQSLGRILGIRLASVAGVMG